VAQRRLHLAVFLRDFHVDKTGPVDIAMLDFLADVMASTNQGHATVLSAYRTRETNERLEATTFGVPEHSQHVVGRASTLPSTVILAGGRRRLSPRSGAASAGTPARLSSISIADPSGIGSWTVPISIACSWAAVWARIRAESLPCARGWHGFAPWRVKKCCSGASPPTQQKVQAIG